MERTKPVRSRAYWDESDWDELAAIVIPMRRNRMTEALSSIANRAQLQLSADRRRPLAAHQLKPLVERIQKHESQIVDKADKCDALERKIEGHTTKEQAIASLTDAEIRSALLPRLLQIISPSEVARAFETDALIGAVDCAELAGVAVKRLVEELLKRNFQATAVLPDALIAMLTNRGNGQPAAAGNGNGKPTEKRKPRIVIVGCIADQGMLITKKVSGSADLIFIETDKVDRQRIPQAADHFILWSRFMSHASQAAVKSLIPAHRITLHHGGIRTLAEKVASLAAS